MLPGTLCSSAIRAGGAGGNASGEGRSYPPSSGAPFHKVEKHFRLGSVENSMWHIRGAVHDRAGLDGLPYSRNCDFARAFCKDEQFFFRMLVDIVRTLAGLDAPRASDEI